MKTKERIEEQKRNDVEFIISAVTCELDSMVYLEYFSTYENNGGLVIDDTEECESCQ